MQQHEREMVVGSLLDVTVDQYGTFVRANEEKILNANEDGAIARVSRMGLFLGRNQGVDSYLFLQEMVLASDETLIEMVTLVTGKNPLEA